MGMYIQSTQRELKEITVAEVQITDDIDEIIATIEVEYVKTVDPDMFDVINEELKAWRLDKYGHRMDGFYHLTPAQEQEIKDYLNEELD